MISFWVQSFYFEREEITIKFVRTGGVVNFEKLFWLLSVAFLQGISWYLIVPKRVLKSHRIAYPVKYAFVELTISFGIFKVDYDSSFLKLKSLFFQIRNDRRANVGSPDTLYYLTEYQSKHSLRISTSE